MGEEYYRRKGEEAVFKMKVREDIPLQRNGVDCGVFVCQYAERIARRASMSFGQADMPATRCKMMEEIFQGIISTSTSPFNTTETQDRKKRKKGKEEARQENPEVKMTEESKNKDYPEN